MIRVLIAALTLTLLAACGFSGGRECLGSFCPEAGTNLDCGGGMTATINANGAAVCPKPKEWK